MAFADDDKQQLKNAAAALYSPLNGALSPRAKASPFVFPTASSSALGGTSQVDGMGAGRGLGPISTNFVAPGPAFPGPSYPGSVAAVGGGPAVQSNAFGVGDQLAPLSPTNFPPPRGVPPPPPMTMTTLSPRELANMTGAQPLPGQVIGAGPGLGSGTGMGGGQMWDRSGAVGNFTQLTPDALDVKGPVVSTKVANV